MRQHLRPTPLQSLSPTFHPQGCNGHSARLFFTIMVILLLPKRAAAFAKPSGHLTLDAQSKNAYDFDIDMKGEFKLKTKRIEKTRAVATIEAGYQSMSLRLEDLYVDYKSSDRLRLTLGMSKKILGLEYEDSKQDRLTIRRSPIYQKMEAQGLVGRQLNLRAHVRLGKKKDGVKLSGALGGDNSRNFNAQLSVQRIKSEWGYGAWLLGELHRINGTFIPVFAESIACWYETKQGRLTLEGFHGIDAQQTELERLFADGRTVHFSGVKLDAAVNIPIGKHLVVSPLAQASFIVDDLAHSETNTVHLLAGVKAEIKRFRFSFNAETYGVKDTINDGTRLFNTESYYGEIAFFF